MSTFAMNEVQQQAEPQQTPDQVEQQWNAYFDEHYGPAQPAQQQEHGQEHVAQMQAQLNALTEEQFQRDVAGILDDYPALNDPELAQEIALIAQQRAHEMGQPELWRNPRFYRQVAENEAAHLLERPGAAVARSILGAAGRLDANGQPRGQNEVRWW
jgi:hypothetical protein